MPKTQTNAQHDFRYETIARAEGEECIVCHFEHFVARKKSRRAYKSLRGYRFEIDHADNNRLNWSWDNLHLACKKHNCALRGMKGAEHIKLMRGYSNQLEREREREGLPTWKSVLKDMIDYEGASTENQLNKIYYKRWLAFAHQYLTENDGSMQKKIFVSQCAKKVGCSLQTSTNYTIVNTSPLGPFKETVNDEGDKSIVYLDKSNRR